MWQRTRVSRNSGKPISFSLWPSSVLRTSHQLRPSLQRDRDGHWSCAWLVRLVGIPLSAKLCHFVHEFKCFYQCFRQSRFLTTCSFKDTGDSVAALKNVQWVYLGIAIFVFLLAFVFFISHIPEVTDADMEFQVQETHVGGSEKPFWKQYRLFHAAFAQFSYTGAQSKKTAMYQELGLCTTG